MAKFNAKENDPERYARVKERNRLSCRHGASQSCDWLACVRIATITVYAIKGEHSWTSEKCPNCGEVVYFPPISFRKASNN